MKNINKIFLATALVCAGLLVWVIAFSGDTQRVEAQKVVNCNVANLGGTYVYGAFGTIHPGNPVGFPPGPYNSTASLFMDGAGNYTVTAKTSYNGTIVDEEFTGEYIVGENCAVTFTYQSVPAVYAIFTNNRSESRAISTFPGTNITYLTVRN